MQAKGPSDKINPQTKVARRILTGKRVVNLPISRGNIGPDLSPAERVGIFAGCLVGIISLSLAFLAAPLTDPAHSSAGTSGLNWFLSEQWWWPFTAFLGVGIIAVILVAVLMNKAVPCSGYSCYCALRHCKLYANKYLRGGS